MHRRIWLIVPALVILATLPARAAERYTFTEDLKGDVNDYTVKGTVLADGNHYRAELEDTRHTLPDVVISKDGGEHETGLYQANRTWYTMDQKKSSTGPWSATSRLFLLMPFLDRLKLKNIETATSEVDEPETFQGRTVRRHRIRLVYDLEGHLPVERIRGKVRLEASFWMAEDLDLPLPKMLRPQIRTTLPEIDPWLSGEIAKLKGTPLRQEWTVSTESKQGTPQSHTTTKTISFLGPATATPALFEIPAGYRYEEPVFQGPG